MNIKLNAFLYSGNIYVVIPDMTYNKRIILDNHKVLIQITVPSPADIAIILPTSDPFPTLVLISRPWESSTRRLIKSTRFSIAAKCSGVNPDLFLMLTSAPSFSNNRTDLSKPCLTQ